MRRIGFIICFLLLFTPYSQAATELVVLYTADTVGYVLPCG